MKRFYKNLCVPLCLAMTVGLLAGCGQKNNGEDAGGENNGQNGEQERPEFVYVAEYIPIQGEFTGTLQSGTYANGSIYAQSYERVWVETEPGEEPPEMVVTNEDDAAETEDAAEETETSATASDLDYEEPSGYWNYEMSLYRIGLDGSSQRIPYPKEETPQSDDPNEYYGSSMQSLNVAADGSIYALERSYHQWIEAPEGVTPETDEDYYKKYYKFEENYQLKRLDSNGALLGTIDLSTLREGASEEDYFYINNFLIDKQGNIYLSSEQGLYILDAEGSLKKPVASESGYIENILLLPDGRIACLMYVDGEGMRLAPVDPDTGTMGEGVAASGDLYNMIPGGGDYDLYYTSGINFYGYSLETGEKEKVLNWLSCDVDPGYDISPIVLEDGRIVVLSSNADYGDTVAMRYGGMMNDPVITNELIILTKTPSEQVPQKQVLTMATMWLDYNVQSLIVNFNKSSDKYRIEVQDYSEYNDYSSENEEDWTAGNTKLQTEILSGNMPDLLNLNGINVGRLAAKGLVEDLYPYIDSDPELNRSDLMENVLKAFERNGKLYTTLSGFNVNTVLGAASIVGDTPGWTVDEFQAALTQMRQLNPDCNAFNQYTTRSDILQTCLYLDLDSYVNWETGECNFDSDGFVKLLEFAGSFPSEFDWENYEWSEEDDEYYRVSHGLQMLQATGFGGFDVYELRIYNKIMGGQATCIGYPTEYGSGNTFSASGSQFAMSSKCADKDAAWQFLRQFFTEKYQASNSLGFPTNVKAFNAQLDAATAIQYQMNYMTGEYLLDEDGNKIEMDYGTWGWDEYEVPGGPVTQAEANQLLELINTTSKVMEYDESIYQIVEEGIEPYFAGQRSASDVAKQIQSKAMIYVNEQR